jgi:phosphoribosylformylglycinamidine synthase
LEGGLGVSGPKFCVIRGPGTNCDIETAYSVSHFGVQAERVHINRLMEGKKDLESYQGLLIAGGFSYGDHIRSGSILGKFLGEKFGDQLEVFIEEGWPVLGICNGFQVLVESGVLPGFDGRSTEPQAVLGTNNSAKYEDRWVYLRNDNREKCIFTRGMKATSFIPVAHGEGKFIFAKEHEKEYLDLLEKNDQVVFRYAQPNGEAAGGKYPDNPNGALSDIAGICDPTGVVLGMMPHPERAFNRITYPDWTLMFKNMVEYVKRRY